MCIALNPSFSILDCITCMHYLHRDGRRRISGGLLVVLNFLITDTVPRKVEREEVRVCRERKRRRRNVVGTECVEMNKFWEIQILL